MGKIGKTFSEFESKERIATNTPIEKLFADKFKVTNASSPVLCRSNPIAFSERVIEARETGPD
jgi:hypothetical protein